MRNKVAYRRALQPRNTFGKINARPFPPLRLHIVIQKSAPSHARLYNLAPAEPLEAGIMNLRRFAKATAALCPTVVLVGWVVAWLAGFGSARTENIGAAPIVDREPSLTADAALADAPRATGNAAVADADAGTVNEWVTGTATETTAASDEPKSIVEVASTDSSQMLPPETPPVQVATASASDPLPNDAKKNVDSIEILDECLVVDPCIDRYLWALYQRAPKEDTIKLQEQRKVTVKVTVKKKLKTVTVTKTFTRLVDEDFTWKDPKAAEKAGMPMVDYVIGGMDRSFKLKLFHLLHAAEGAGLSPGITSAFRDDYRQSIASGLRAATDRSYHGGSFRGGYGHGLAADVVSVKGETRAQRWIATENLWKWVDAHGKEFGIGRPYLDRDPPHVAPIDGKEYAAHHREPKAQHAASDMKKRKRLAVRDDHSVTKRAKNAKLSKVAAALKRS
jgi:hypothetical protein